MTRVLAIGAHPDDVELGCGATMRAHHNAGHVTDMLVMTGGERSRGAGAARRRLEQIAAAEVLGCTLHWAGFTDCDLPSEQVLIEAIESACDALRPDVIYVHAPHDSHQDHRAVAAATVSVARRTSRVLLYQSPSTLQFEPTVFVDVESHLPAKLEALACHRSQVGSGSVQLDAISASARHWGANARVLLAEAFVPVRFVWNLAPEDHSFTRIDETLADLSGVLTQR